MTAKTPLMSADFDIELEHVNEDLAWGAKTWTDAKGTWYLVEAHFRIEGNEEQFYLREKSLDPIRIMKVIARLVSDEAWRREMMEHQQAYWTTARVV